jgi:uncharacterized protein YndB with AHSA1/START domain
MSEQLRSERLIRADIERVFAAWSEAELIARLFGCPSSRAAEASADFRVGGAYRVLMHDGEHTIGIAHGRYLAIDPPRRIVFSWASEGRVDVAASTVTIELEPVGDHTLLRLTHDLDPNSPAGIAHARGWHGCLTNLGATLMQSQTLAVVRDYHRGWTTKNFDAAIDRLAPNLAIEVPVNTYATKESFAQALVGFGGMVERVDLLAEFAHDDEAMLLYDMQVANIGTLRVAEHFTVRDGAIVRLRQIHDTMPVRAAGFA